MELSLIVMVMICCMPVIEARCKKRSTTPVDPCDDCIMVSVLSVVDNVNYKYRLCDGGGQGVCHPSRGRLEVNYDNTWGSICDTNWSIYRKRIASENANVACEMFGFTGGQEAPHGPATEGVPIHLDDVLCSGGEASIADCGHAPWGDIVCSRFDVVGIDCSNEE